MFGKEHGILRQIDRKVSDNESVCIGISLFLWEQVVTTCPARRLCLSLHRMCADNEGALSWSACVQYISSIFGASE